MSKVVKISLDSDIRRITISSNSFAEFVNTVNKLFIDSIPDNFVVKYQDEENDLVSITCDRELAEAMQYAAKPLLRLFIVETKPSKPVDTTPVQPAERLSVPCPGAGVDALHRIVDQALNCPELRSVIAAFGLNPESIVSGPLSHLHEACTAMRPAEEMEKDVSSSAEPAVHNAICDHCEKEVRGIRFKCTYCPDFDLCEACERLVPSASVHDTQHLFLKVHTPVRLPSRRPLLPNFYERESQWGKWGHHGGGGGGWGGCRRRWGGRGPHWRHCEAAPNGAPASTDNNGTAETPAAPPSVNESPCGRWRWQRPGHGHGPRWLGSRFVADVTIDDGTQMAPGTTFTKVWRLRNTGSAEWPANTCLSFVAGDALGAPGGGAAMRVSEAPVAPGQEVDVAVAMVAPEMAGRYISNWRLMTPDGIAFGHRVWADIMVVLDEEKVEEASAPASVVADEAAASPAAPTPLVPLIPLIPLVPLAAPAPVAVEEKETPKQAEEAVSPPPAPVVPAEPFAEQLGALLAMGFSDLQANRRVLAKRKGDIVRAVHDLLG